jgi:hypothetical protein
MHWEMCLPRARRRLANELPTCASPSSTSCRPRGRQPKTPPNPVARSCRPSAQPRPGWSYSPRRSAGLKTNNKETKVGSGSRASQINKRKRQKSDSPSTCLLSELRAWRASSASHRRSRTVASCSSRNWRKSLCETPSWVSSPLSRETSSSRCLRVA